MKLRSKGQMSIPTRPNTFLCWSQRLFFLIGILALGYVGFVLVDAKLYQAYYTWRFQQDLDGLKPSVGSGDHLPPVPAEADRAKV